MIFLHMLVPEQQLLLRKISPHFHTLATTQEIGSNNCSRDWFEGSNFHRILGSSLHPFPYKIHCHQFIPSSAVWQRLKFVNRKLNMIDNDVFDVDCIWFTNLMDSSSQNWRFWSSENSYLCEVKPFHYLKVTFWAAVCSRGIIGPFSICETIISESNVAIFTLICHHTSSFWGSTRKWVVHIRRYLTT